MIETHAHTGRCPRCGEDASQRIQAKRRVWSKESEILHDQMLQYGQVVKQRGRRLVAVIRRIIFGVDEVVLLKQISTSLLEKLNVTIHQNVVPLHRKTRSFAKHRTSLETQAQLFGSLGIAVMKQDFQL